MYTKSEVLEFIEEEDVKFIRLAFFDLKGKQKIFRLCQANWDEPLKAAFLLMLLP